MTKNVTQCFLVIKLELLLVELFHEFYISLFFAKPDNIDKIIRIIKRYIDIITSYFYII